MRVYGTERYPSGRDSDRFSGLMHQPHSWDGLPTCWEAVATWQVAGFQAQDVTV